MIRVCSGFSPQGKKIYGERFLSGFDGHWPAEIELRVYVEEPMQMPRDACRSLWEIPGALQFNERHRSNPAIAGRVSMPGWKEAERRRGYSFRHDALKFWKQILIPEAAAADLADGDVLAWLDADVETFRRPPANLILQLLGSAEVCFLGREPRHSEIGFWAVRLNPRTRAFLHEIAETYRSDRFLQLPEWHSAFVWDHVRRRSGLSERDLTPGGHGHVWPRSPLGRYMRHDKGPRKPGGLR